MIIFILFSLVQSCTLLDGQSSTKPKPSLTKCYRYNPDACCVSAHDSGIQDDYSKLLSSQCQREYDPLESYYCYGCNAAQEESVNEESKTIYLCRSFATQIWGGDLTKPTTTFDNCGLTTFWRENPVTVQPSSEWANAFQFFWEVKPTFFSDYYVQIVDDDWNDGICYGFSKVLAVWAGLSFIMI